MKLYEHPYVPQSDKLMLVKIDYPYTEEELEDKLSSLTKLEGAFITAMSQSLPFHCWYHSKGYSEIDLIDQEVFQDLKYLLHKYNVEYQVTDLSEDLISNSTKINHSFKFEVIEFIDRIMHVDEILDRLHVVGRNRLNPFELLYLDRYSKGIITF